MGAVAPLVGLLDADGHAGVQTNAAVALAKLAADEGVRQTLRDMHAIEKMYALGPKIFGD